MLQGFLAEMFVVLADMPWALGHGLCTLQSFRDLDRIFHVIRCKDVDDLSRRRSNPEAAEHLQKAEFRSSTSVAMESPFRCISSTYLRLLSSKAKAF